MVSARGTNTDRDRCGQSFPMLFFLPWIFFFFLFSWQRAGIFGNRLSEITWTTSSIADLYRRPSRNESHPACILINRCQNLICILRHRSRFRKTHSYRVTLALQSIRITFVLASAKYMQCQYKIRIGQWHLALHTQHEYWFAICNTSAT